MALANGKMKWRRVIVLVTHEPWMAPHECLHMIEITGMSGEVHAPDGICRRGSAIGNRDDLRRTQLNRPNRWSVRWRQLRGGVELLDVLRERCPTLESVLAREDELCIAECDLASARVVDALDDIAHALHRGVITRARSEE